MAVPAAGGVFHIRSSLNAPVALDGEWDFFPGQLGTEGKAVALKMPSTWNKVQSSHGCGTFRLRIILPPATDLALRIPDIGTASSVFINGKQVTQNGTVSCSAADFVPRVQPQLVDLPTGTAVDLEIRAANFADRKGGPWGSVLIGPRRQLEHDRSVNAGYEALLAGATMLMGFYHLFLYFFRRRDRSPLFFGIFCLLIGLRSLLTGERWLLSSIPDMPFWLSFRMEYLTGYLAAPVFLHFFHRLHAGRLSDRWLQMFDLATWPVFLVFLLPAAYYTRTLPYYQVVILAATVYVLFHTVHLSLRGVLEARLCLAGVLILAACVVLEVLHNEHIFRARMVVPVGLTIFLFFQSLVLAVRFSRAFTESEALADRLVAFDTLKDNFLTDISHELRIPLQGIIGTAEHLLSNGQVERTPIETIRYSARRLSTLVQDILDFSRLRNNDIRLELRPVDLRAAVSLVFDTTGAFARRRGLELCNSVPDGTFVSADEFRLQQILFNLIGAAVKHAHEGTVDVRAWVHGQRILIEVAASCAFAEPFDGADNPADEERAGGISLSIARALVELHGSKLDEVAGSRAFRFHLQPAIEAVQQIQRGPFEAAPERPLPSPDAGQEALIFIVDDEETNATGLSVLLSMYSDVRVFSGARAALDAIEDGIRPDLILLDIMMPGMNGIEMCRELRKRYAPFETPVIFLSALDKSRTVILALDAGANDYLTKPFEREELLARVRNQILLGRLARENVAMARRQVEMSRLVGQERARMYRDLHDGVASDLNAILIAVRALRKSEIASDEALMESIEKSAMNGLGEIRELVNADDEGSLTWSYFSVWLQSQIRDAARASGMGVELTFDPDPGLDSLPFGVSAHLKKICREIIQNALKHADATVLQASLVRSLQGFRLHISDNGRGFEAETVRFGTGLRSMERRALESGIMIVRFSSPGSGTAYEITIPSRLTLAAGNHPNGGLTFFETAP